MLVYIFIFFNAFLVLIFWHCQSDCCLATYETSVWYRWFCSPYISFREFAELLIGIHVFCWLQISNLPHGDWALWTLVKLDICLINHFKTRPIQLKAQCICYFHYNVLCSYFWSLVEWVIGWIIRRKVSLTCGFLNRCKEEGMMQNRVRMAKCSAQ